jgi:hemoglobin
MNPEQPPAQGPPTADSNLAHWQALGGDEVMLELLQNFYQRIQASSIAHLFPPDLEETRAKQFAFQSDIWGGPPRYRQLRGEPRMRMRHLPFRITRTDADT